MVLGRFLAALGAVALIGVTAQPAAAADPPSTDQPAPAAAGWLARQLVNGERFESTFDGQVFPDQGLTIDAVFGFAAAGFAADNADKAMAWLAKPEILGGYLGAGPAEDPTEVYAGAHAKLALAAHVQGQDPAAFGGVDLPARLRSLLTDSGRFSDRSQFGDFSNVFSQSLALLALDRTPGGAPEPAVAFLVDSQCPDGGFALNFGGPSCASETDATALAVQALLAVDEALAATDGLDWLVEHQQTDGGFGGGGPTSGANANSTGLAAQALRVGDRDAAADAAIGFLRGLQVGCSGATANRGGIALDASGFQQSTAPRATAQAILGLAGVGLATMDGTQAEAPAPALRCATPTSPPGGGAGGLPVTGLPVGAMVALGVLLLGAGAVALLAARRRRSG